MTDIIVVEDNSEMAALLCDFLRAEGYSTEHCPDGESALRLFEAEGARLVILDIMLPGLDGFGVCRRIREKANTPVFIVSAKTEKEDKLNGLILGADDYIEKPYDIDILLAKVKGIFIRRYHQSVISDGFLKIDKDKGKKEGYDTKTVTGAVSLDDEYPGCPYCGEKRFYICQCGKIVCYHGQSRVTCPNCGQSGILERVERINLNGGGF